MLIDYVIAYLIDKMQKIYGKVALQKLLYFVKESGVPIECDFGMHIFGPFSLEVASSYDIWQAKKILKAVPTDFGYHFEKGDECQQLLADGKGQLQKYIPALEKMIADFGALRPRDLELYATVHFINKRLKDFHGKAEKDRLIKEVVNEKGVKFSAKEIRESYSKLVGVSMI